MTGDDSGEVAADHSCIGVCPILYSSVCIHNILCTIVNGNANLRVAPITLTPHRPFAISVPCLSSALGISHIVSMTKERLSVKQ